MAEITKIVVVMTAFRVVLRGILVADLFLVGAAASTMLAYLLTDPANTLALMAGAVGICLLTVAEILWVHHGKASAVQREG